LIHPDFSLDLFLRMLDLNGPGFVPGLGPGHEVEIDEDLISRGLRIAFDSDHELRRLISDRKFDDAYDLVAMRGAIAKAVIEHEIKAARPARQKARAAG
jgi:hypothetical protein